MRPKPQVPARCVTVDADGLEKRNVTVFVAVTAYAQKASGEEIALSGATITKVPGLSSVPEERFNGSKRGGIDTLDSNWFWNGTTLCASAIVNWDTIATGGPPVPATFM